MTVSILAHMKGGGEQEKEGCLQDAPILSQPKSRVVRAEGADTGIERRKK